METFSALLDLCAGNSPVNGEFPAQRPVALNFYVVFDLGLNKWLSKQWWGWWFWDTNLPGANELKVIMTNITYVFFCVIRAEIVSVDMLQLQNLLLHRDLLLHLCIFYMY